jgi:hypothetical protein
MAIAPSERMRVDIKAFQLRHFPKESVDYGITQTTLSLQGVSSDDLFFEKGKRLFLPFGKGG